MSAIATSVLRVSLGALTLGPRADICNVVAEHWRKLMKQVFDSYRPELHYMRGPGPKWHEKHAPQKSAVIQPLVQRATA